MHPDFADWYRIVDPAASSEMLALRWKGIEQFISDPTPELMNDLVCIHYGLEAPQKVVDELRDAFKKTDETFPNRNNGQLLAVLASACVASVLDDQNAIADHAALAIVCGSYCGKRQGAVEEMLGKVEDYLQDRSLSRFAEARPKAAAGISIDAADLKTKLEHHCKPDESIKQLAPLLDEVIAEVTQFANKIAAKINALISVQSLQQEELDIVWWLFGSKSRDLGLAFSAIGMPGACLTVAKELKDLVSILPGPFAASSFLSRALSLAGNSEGNTATILTVVNSTQRNWRSDLVRRLPANQTTSVDRICPVICAIKRSLETPGANDWLTQFQTVTTLDPQEAIDTQRLSMQLYQELLLMQTASASE